jgi:alpha-D-xyloside xylohydrolase
MEDAHRSPFPGFSAGRRFSLAPVRQHAMVPAMAWAHGGMRRLVLLIALAAAGPLRAEPVTLAGAKAALAFDGAFVLADEAGHERARLLPGGLAWIDAAGSRQAAGALLRSEPTADGLAFVLQAPGGEARVVARWRGERTLELRFTPPPGSSVSALEARLALAPGEAIWGLTERIADGWRFPLDARTAWIDLVPREVGGLDRRGETVSMWLVPTVAAYAPFYTSSRGYGLLVDGSWPGRFDLGDSEPDVLALRFETGAEPVLRLFLFVGDPRQVVEAYTALSGRPRRPPDWALGHWIWHDEHRVAAPARALGVAMNAEVAEDLRWHQSLGLPAGVYLFDRPWTPGRFGFGSLPLRFDEARFPNAPAMLAALHGAGWHTLVWSAAFAVEDTDLGRVAREESLLAPGSDKIVDLTLPGARALWTAAHLAFLRESGVHGIKLDRGEEFLPSRPQDRWGDGRSGREMHNAYPLLQLGLYEEILRKAWGDDFVLVARATWTGAQRHGQVWAGDLPGSHLAGRGPSTDLGLRAALIGMLRCGFLGLPFWGSDVGGYYPFADREVFARWLELGTFSPLFEIGGIGSRWPWAMPDTPHYDAELVAIYRDAIRLREALRPYLSKHADEAARSGLPLARAVVFDHPDDARWYDVWDEYLLGDALLVAPVWRSGERARDVLLPPGVWEDYWDRSRRHEGPATLRAEAPLGRIPVFVRAGAEVPAPETR